ncbi:MAG: peptidylprolyl isomerase [Epsilonproteobacteria bacterium]|nr:peptidylprolyl isomerase [Campylobacterota bacterium]
MTIAKENSVVSLGYTLVEAGKSEVIDSNVGRAPLEFITGKSHIIPGLEKALIDMKVGDKGDILVVAAEAYGEVNPEAIQTLPRDQFEGIDLKEGMVLYGQGEHGQTVQVVVKAFDDAEVTIDYNHPLAGKDLMFSVEVMGIRDATVDEAMTGQIACNDQGGCCGGGGHSHNHGHSQGGGGCCGGGHCH